MDPKKYDLACKVKLYLKRLEKDRRLESYPPNKKGTWFLVGGRDDSTARMDMKPDLVKGRFIDAIACAVQQKNFYDVYGVEEGNPNYENHGYIELWNPSATQLKTDKGLVRQVNEIVLPKVIKKKK